MIEPNHPAPQYADRQIIEALHGGHVHRFNRTYGDGDTSLTRGAVASIANLVNSASRAAFDAGREHERSMPDGGSRPWEPLNGPLYKGDEVRQEHKGVTSTAVVGRVDGEGDPWTAEDRFIGVVLGEGTWYVRRPVQELPTTPGTPIVRADGHKYIEAEFSGAVWRTREAVLCGDGLWHGVWRAGRSAVGSASPEFITSGTWQEDNR